MEPVDLGKYTFLIVEDQRMTRIQMVNMMKVMGISAVLTASNGQEAIETMAGPSDIACVIADIEMPVMHGIEMLKRIRVGYEGVARNVPVIMTTGHSERDTLGVAMALDVSAFLLKPVKMEPLRDRILRAISLIDSNEQWLKPSTAYGCIHVSESLEDILAGSEEDAAPTTRVDDALERLAERRVIMKEDKKKQWEEWQKPQRRWRAGRASSALTSEHARRELSTSS